MKIFERLLWTVGGVAAGHIIGSNIGETEEERKQNALKGRWIGGASALGGTFVFDKVKDTVNYTGLDKNGKRVYEGIAFEDRVDKRISEHKTNGKVFHKVIVSQPKTREAALDLERYRIKRFNPKLNIHHNG